MKQTKHLHDIILAVVILTIFVMVKIPYVSTIISSILILAYSSIKKELKNGLGFIWPNEILKTLGLSFLIASILVACSFYVFLPTLEYFTGVPLKLGPFSQMEGNISLLITSLCIGWIFGGFMEEIIFRGFFISRILTFLPDKSGIIFGVLTTSILFGYLHGYQGITGQLTIGITGIILGSIYLLNQRKIWMNIFIHGFVNTISMILLFFGVL